MYRPVPAALLALATSVAGAVLPRQNLTPLTTAQAQSFQPYAFFAAAGYCQPANTLAWNCGTNCNSLAGFQPTASGGNGDSVQFWFVGFHPPLNSVIVSHQGTNPAEIEALITDADAFLSSLDSTLFPGVSSSVETHTGFADDQASTAPQILAAVQHTLAAHPGATVTLTGHSLGAALSLLDAVFLKLHLPGTTFKVAVFGLPRVGNQAFANLVDSMFPAGTLNHVNNKEDFVPILPGMFLGYRHPSGEIHIEDSGTWMLCAGQDNPSTECTTGDVPNIFEGNESDHDGPYDGVEMVC